MLAILWNNGSVVSWVILANNIFSAWWWSYRMLIYYLYCYIASSKLTYDSDILYFSILLHSFNTEYLFF
jgi:hypothetical protein